MSWDFPPLVFFFSVIPIPGPWYIFKGSVQRRLRRVENGVKRSVGVSNCGTGHSFVVLFRFHLNFAIFLFPASTARFIGEFWKNR